MTPSHTAILAVALTATVVVGLVGWDAVVAPRTFTSLTRTIPTATAQGESITEDTKVVTIGDSIMAGHGLKGPSAAWPALLEARTGIHVTNDSCSGAGFVAVGSCGSDYAGLIKAAVVADPSIVLIESSDNDIGADPAKLLAATTKTFATLRRALPEARIVGLSTLWDKSGSVPEEIDRTSADLKRAVKTSGSVFLNIGQPLSTGVRLLQSDSEHPTVAGEQVLETAILADLRVSCMEA